MLVAVTANRGDQHPLGLLSRRRAFRDGSPPRDVNHSLRVRCPYRRIYATVHLHHHKGHGLFRVRSRRYEVGLCQARNKYHGQNRCYNPRSVIPQNCCHFVLLNHPIRLHVLNPSHSQPFMGLFAHVINQTRQFVSGNVKASLMRFGFSLMSRDCFYSHRFEFTSRSHYVLLYGR